MQPEGDYMYIYNISQLYMYRAQLDSTVVNLT